VPISPLETVVRSLHFQDDRTDLLRSLPESVWPSLLHLTDEARLTLPLAIRCGANLPATVRRRVQQDLKRNAERYVRTVAEWREIATVLQRRGIEVVLLKGLTHWPFYCDDPAHRPQYDLDFYCPEESIHAAGEAITTLGYESSEARHEPSAQHHLRAMIRRSGFRWQGDYFDPALPLLVEPHFRFWDARTEFFGVRSTEAFWERRTTRTIGDLTVPALHPIDGLSYATWHATRHLLRGNLRLYHVYEIAHFLHGTHDHDAFWREWSQANAGPECVAEPIAFRLAVEWFGCRANVVVEEQIRQLPRPVSRWFELFSFSPVTAMERLNKDEIFLHLSLVAGRRERRQIATQRIFPRNPPNVVLDAHLPAVSAGLRIRRVTHKAGFLIRRAARHTGALWPVLRSGLKWWRSQ
jgi:Uncharacterised nucleotidyltransferase